MQDICIFRAMGLQRDNFVLFSISNADYILSNAFRLVSIRSSGMELLFQKFVNLTNQEKNVSQKINREYSMKFLQHCKFVVGSYAYDIENVQFSTVIYNMELDNNHILDYIFKTKPLNEDDRVQLWPSTGKNYSLSGFEIKFHRHTTKYIVQYYLTSGLFVVVSWVMF